MFADTTNKDLADRKAVQPHDRQWLVQGQTSGQGMYRFRVTNWTRIWQHGSKISECSSQAHNRNVGRRHGSSFKPGLLETEQP